MGTISIVPRSRCTQETRSSAGTRDRVHDHSHGDIGHEQPGQQQPREYAGHEQSDDRGLRDYTVDDERDARRDEGAEGAARGERSGGQLSVVLALLQLGQGHGSDGRGGGDTGARHRREQAAGRDVRVEQAAGQELEPAGEAAIQLPAEPRAQDDLSHEDEERNRGQHEVVGEVERGDADGARQRSAEQKVVAEKGREQQREGDVLPEQQQDDQRRQQIQGDFHGATRSSKREIAGRPRVCEFSAGLPAGHANRRSGGPGSARK